MVRVIRCLCITLILLLSCSVNRDLHLSCVPLQSCFQIKRKVFPAVQENQLEIWIVYIRLCLISWSGGNQILTMTFNKKSYNLAQLKANCIRFSLIGRMLLPSDLIRFSVSEVGAWYEKIELVFYYYHVALLRFGRVEFCVYLYQSWHVGKY